MVSTFTPNLGLEEPARGDQVGTWDTPVNSNMTLVDLTLGGTTVIPLTNANVVLSAAQYKCKTIVFTGALSGNVVITFPNTFLKSYEIFNTCTGNFVVQLANGVGGSNVIAAPAGECSEVMNLNGGGLAGLFYKNLGRIGSYTDFGSASIPLWIQFCTVPPYLNCDGSAFNTSTYPILAILLGGGTLPDLRGRVRACTNQGTGRLTAGGSGVNGDVLLAAGGAENIVLQLSQIPSHNHPNSLNDPGHAHNYTQPVFLGGQTGGGAFPEDATTQTGTTTVNGSNISINNGFAGGSGGHVNAQPTTIGGIQMIRAG